MFFEKIEELPVIASRVNTAVFVLPKNVSVEIKNALTLQPEGKSVITIEQVREVMARINVRQTSDIYVVIRPADMLGEAAANALLKSLEEPGDKVHFVLITDGPSKLLPTILSRSAAYFWKNDVAIDGKINASDKDKALAKRLLVAKQGELVDIADEIAKKKDGVRAYALEILGIAIEMLYKTYFLTGKDVFVQKLPKFLRAYENIAKNGHIKLQIVSNLC